MSVSLLRFDGVMERDPAIDAWLDARPGEFGRMARKWFDAMRRCGDEVREVLHDGCPHACLGDVPFGYVNVFASHVNVGFFQGARLRDPDRLMEGSGKFMRHVKLQADGAVDEAALGRLIERAYAEMKELVENG